MRCDARVLFAALLSWSAVPATADVFRDELAT